MIGLVHLTNPQIHTSQTQSSQYNLTLHSNPISSRRMNNRSIDAIRAMAERIPWIHNQQFGQSRGKLQCVSIFSMVGKIRPVAVNRLIYLTTRVKYNGTTGGHCHGGRGNRNFRRKFRCMEFPLLPVTGPNAAA